MKVLRKVNSSVLQRLECRNIGELVELLGYVSVCVPDMFPDDEDSEGEPQNMQEAFVEIYAAFEDLARIDSRHRFGLQPHLETIKKAESESLKSNYKECISLLDQTRKSLSSGLAPIDVQTSTQSPQDQCDSLLNEVITLSQQIITHDGSHIPFAIVLRDDGEIETILVDDTETQDPAVLADTLTESIRVRKDLAAVAFATNMEYQKSNDATRSDAIVIDIDHKKANAVTCVLPYDLNSSGEISLFELFSVDARKTFFSAEEKIRLVD